MQKDLTIFVIKSGNNPNFNDCVAAINQQTIQSEVNIIENYAPMSVAFQEMLNRCKTPYYIQVDEDMILQPSATEKMLNAIKTSDNKTAMICFKLHDTHLDFDLFGVKIYKNEIFQKYPYNLNVISCEVEQINRLKQDGYTFRTIEEIIGEHSPKWNGELIFDRYYDLMEKFKVYGYGWLEEVPSKLNKMLTANPSSNNFYAMAGILASIFSNDIKNKEKNFAIKDENYLKVKSWLSSPHQATLYVTNRCNYKCKFCLRQGNLTEIEDFPDTLIDTCELLLNKFPTIKGVCICGFGEPFLSPHLKWIIQYLNNRNVVTGLITNGSLLRDKIDDLILPSYISVSLNAINAQMHEEQTGVPNMFDIVCEGIMKTTKKVPTYLSYVCDKKTIQYIPEFLVLAKKLGVKGVYLHNILPHLLTTEDNKNEFLSSVLTIKDTDLVEQLRSLPDSNMILKYPTLIDPEKPLRFCEFPFNSIAINGNGSISVCNSIYPPSKKNGNIRDIPLWHNKYCEGFRQQFAQKELPTPCKYCFRNWEPT